MADPTRTADELSGQLRLRGLCWELGKRFPPSFSGDRVALAMVHPHQAYLSWSLDDRSVSRLSAGYGDAFSSARMVLRIYDITDVVFDGLNAHTHYDIDVSGLSGSYYFRVPVHARDLIAEVGFLLTSGELCPLARSLRVFTDRHRPVSRFSLRGLYVGKGFRRVVAVENIGDAAIYERLDSELADVEREGPLRIATLHEGFGDHTETLIDRLADKGGALTIEQQRFGSRGRPTIDAAQLVADVEARAEEVAEQVMTAHRESPFDLLHCHDWSALPAALDVQGRLAIPLVLSLHTTEIERAGNDAASGASAAIREWERRGVARAMAVLVPHSHSRQQVLACYGAHEREVLIVPDPLEDQEDASPDIGQAKARLGLSPTQPMALFAGEISHAAGADLLVDALLTVAEQQSGTQTAAQFVFAGEGPLKAELEGRTARAGLAPRCRFLGHVAGEAFDLVLAACDFVVIPSRTWQDESLALLAASYGKPVLTTHQAQLHCIVHGENGLVTYDNPGSIVWGINELIANPLQSAMLRRLARQRAHTSQSLESISAELYLAYARVLADPMASLPEAGGA